MKVIGDWTSKIEGVYQHPSGAVVRQSGEYWTALPPQWTFPEIGFASAVQAMAFVERQPPLDVEQQTARLHALYQHSSCAEMLRKQESKDALAPYQGKPPQLPSSFEAECTQEELELLERSMKLLEPVVFKGSSIVVWGLAGRINSNVVKITAVHPDQI